MEGRFIQRHKARLTDEEKIPLVAAEDLKFILGAAWMSCLGVLPRSRRPAAINKVCNLLGGVLYKANGRDAQRVRLYLKYFFEGRWSDQEIEYHIRRQLSMTVWNSLMLGLLPSLTAEQMGRLVDLRGIQYLDDILSRRHPTLMLGCHLGPFALLIAALLKELGYPVHFVGHAFPRQHTSRLYQKVYYERVTQICDSLDVFNPLDGPQRRLLEVFRRGEILFFLPDQYHILGPNEKMPQQMVQVPFLRGRVTLETGGLRLGKRLGAEVLTVMPFMVKNGHRVLIEPLELPSKGTTPSDLADDLKVFLDLIEQRLHEQPFLWRDLRRLDLFQRMGISDGPQVP
jgi:lauroyl/myristoyl acyltransferase